MAYSNSTPWVGTLAMGAGGKQEAQLMLTNLHDATLHARYIIGSIGLRYRT